MPLYWIWFSLLSGLSCREKIAMLEHFQDPEILYRTEDFTALPGVTEEMAQALGNKDTEAAQKVLKDCSRQGIGILTYRDAGYPRLLRNISDPPLVLYYRGVLPDFETRPVIGVVGTRKATSYGMGIANTIAGQLSASGALVVSGGAAGIDTEALKGALAAGGQCVAVLGCGVDVVYPMQNANLFDLIRKNGCLLSEFLPGMRPLRWMFPQRNRIISGLSDGVLVVEAPEKSGALITAQAASSQGKDVFAVPGNVGVATSVGSNMLLQDGASAVLCGWDIMKEYQDRYPDTVEKREPVLRPLDFEPMEVQRAVAQKAAVPVQRTEKKKDIDNPQDSNYSVLGGKSEQWSPEEAAIIACLNKTPRPVDDVIAQVGRPAGEVLSVLTRLVVKGKVINHPGRQVSVK